MAFARACLSLFLLLTVAGPAWAQKQSDFSGEEKRNNDRPCALNDVETKDLHSFES